MRNLFSHLLFRMNADSMDDICGIEDDEEIRFERWSDATITSGVFNVRVLQQKPLAIGRHCSSAIWRFDNNGDSVFRFRHRRTNPPPSTSYNQVCLIIPLNNVNREMIFNFFCLFWPIHQVVVLGKILLVKELVLFLCTISSFI